MEIEKKKGLKSNQKIEKKERRIDVGYIRVVGIKKDKENLLQIGKKYETIPLSSGSTLMHLLSGEKKEVNYFYLSLFLSFLSLSSLFFLTSFFLDFLFE